ncbi:MAG: hypothetical protein NVS3B10_26550 [Polyangiales bacterium]
MKLDRVTSSLAAAGFAAAFACGCSATTSHSAQTASADALASNVAGTTNLMSAELAGPAPRVGKAHSTMADDGALSDEPFDTTGAHDESAPKEARRSDGSHRGGGFGTSSK